MQNYIDVLKNTPKLALECGALPANWCQTNDLNVVLGYIITWLIGLIGGVLAIVILVSAIQFITSAGSPDRIKSAKDRLTQAAVSLALLVSFTAIINLFNQLFNNVRPEEGFRGEEFPALTQLINNATTILLFIVGATCVIMIVIGGIQYIASAGDANRVSTAKKTITYAIGGLVLALSAGAIIQLINQLFFK